MDRYCRCYSYCLYPKREPPGLLDRWFFAIKRHFHVFMLFLLIYLALSRYHYVNILQKKHDKRHCYYRRICYNPYTGTMEAVGQRKGEKYVFGTAEGVGRKVSYKM